MTYFYIQAEFMSCPSHSFRDGEEDLDITEYDITESAVTFSRKLI